MQILAQFLFRLAFGLAFAMACTPSRWVVSGFFRNHLYVLLGLHVGAIMVALGAPSQFPLWPPVAGAVLSYFGAISWLYEKPLAGKAFLSLVAVVSLAGSWLALPPPDLGTPAGVLRLVDPIAGGLLLGFTIGAMFLGHWYLNSPTMDLAPLRRLLLLMGVAVALRAAVSGTGLALQAGVEGVPFSAWWLFVSLRWLAGIVGVAGITVMAWETLKIPNTQSATGILYVGVIGVFLGELAGQLLSTGIRYPV